MDHDALLAFLRKLALASAPLITTGCNDIGLSSGGCPTYEVTISLASLQGDAASLDGGDSDGGLAELCSRAFPGEHIDSCTLATDDGGEVVHVAYNSYCHSGRRPPGLVSPSAVGRAGPLGAWLASVAHLEAASIDAFGILADELEVHGAPSALVDAACTSADDERRHARLMSRLAIAAGARPPAVHVARHAPRDLETVARENAAEGCVRETFAALIAWRQARLAADPAIRETMGTIAADETRHAALSWAIDAWSRHRLSKTVRHRVRGARTEAIGLLLREIAVSETASVRLPAGLPDGAEAVDTASALFARLA